MLEIVSDCLNSDGSVPFDHAAPDGRIGPLGYSQNMPLGTTATVAVTDIRANGVRFTQAGVLRLYDATSALPAGYVVQGGMAVSSDGQLCITTEIPGASAIKIAGVAVRQDGAVYATVPSFSVQFNDSGSGAVNTTAFGNGASVAATFTNATVRWTKLASGLWGAVATGVARSCYLGANTAVGSYGGYFAEGAATQLVTPTASIRDMTNAAWVKVNVTAAKTATGIDGVANSASTLTATANGGTILQTLVAAASTRTYHCFMRRRTGVGTVVLSQGATTSDITSQINSVTYTRVSLSASVLNAAFGITLGTSGDEIDVDFNQFEAGAFATSPLAAAGAVRNADVLTYPFAGNASASVGSAYAEVSVMFATAPAITAIISTATGGANTPLQIPSGVTPTQIRLRDGTTTTTRSGITSFNGSVEKVASSWGGSTSAVTGQGLSAQAGTFDGDIGSTSIAIGVDNGGAANHLFGTIKNARIWTTQFTAAQLAAITA